MAAAPPDHVVKRRLWRRRIALACAAQVVLMPFSALVVAAFVEGVADNLAQVTVIFISSNAISGAVVLWYMGIGTAETLKAMD